MDLSSATLRVVEGMPGSALRCGESGLPPGVLEEGTVKDQGAVGQALRQVIARSEITATRALVAVSDSLASFRVLSFPMGTTDGALSAAVKNQLDLGSERMAYRYFDIPSSYAAERLVLATVWDRHHVDTIVGAVRAAGLDPAVVDLKSMCMARTLTVDSCLLLDLLSKPCEAVLVDDRLPRVWHSFDVDRDGDVAQSIAAGLRPLVGFQRYAYASFGPESPILVRAEPALAADGVARLEQLTGRVVLPVPMPPRVGDEVRYLPYLTCLGLLMRRSH